MIDFSLTHEQTMLVKTIASFVHKELLPLENELEEQNTLDQSHLQRIRKISQDLGLFAMNIPTEYGGAGLSVLDLVIAEEQCGYASDLLVRRAFGNVYETLLCGTDEQIRSYLLPCVSAQRSCSLALTEPEAGSDAASIKTRAVKKNGSWLLNGSKHFISDAEHSDFFLVSAVTEPVLGAHGISVFIVEKQQPGFKLGRNQHMLGFTGTSHNELFFENIKLYDSHLLGKENQGFKIIQSALNRARLSKVAARALGKAVRLMELMSQHAKERRQFEHAIGDYQFIQQMLADSAMELNAARLMLWNAAVAVDKGTAMKEQVSMVKVYITETLGRVADRAVQIFGGMGCCKDFPIEHLYRDARLYRIIDGTSEIHRQIIARGSLQNGSLLYGCPLI